MPTSIVGAKLSNNHAAAAEVVVVVVVMREKERDYILYFSTFKHMLIQLVFLVTSVNGLLYTIFLKRGKRRNGGNKFL